MSRDHEQSTDITKEQLSDVYTAGTSDGIIQTERGLIRIAEDGNLDEQFGEQRSDDSDS